ncbi:AMP-binding protein [Noviherbaspirillum pedocola]|uniref:AMP-binding protein n=1 Tax=Noviherbaspirillum pedocola TaxID=2801341 RepID=A0A934T1H2_9BURK|nr:AMP-binding protein [Noviherbaspirillum pedocola]MBK4739385.1 AMP-binding protein [Noviherbaspirillum pedocola]
MDNNLFTHCSAGDLVMSAIERGGDRIAFIQDDRQITYREFGKQLSCFIQALDARGVRKGDIIATLSPNRTEVFIVTAAAYMMGLCVVAINPTSSEDDHVYMMADSGATTLFVDPDMFAARAKAMRQRVPTIRQVMSFGPNDFGEDILEVAAQFSPRALVPQAQQNTLSMMFYTGGTTGKSKGVVHTHRVTVASVLLEMADWDWPGETRFLAMTPISHASGSIILPVLLRSGTFVMNKGFSPEKFFQIVAIHRITATFLVPTMLYVLLDHPELRHAKIDSLELIVYGAAPMNPTRLTEGIRVFGPVFMQLYGQTEVPMAITVLRKKDHDPDRYPHRLMSCGVPVAGNMIRLLDSNDNPVADGDVGEICVRSPLVMARYWNKPEETDQVFRNGWMHTGDLARRDADGFLYIVDRSKDMVITGGFNVYPREVEDVISGHPAVASNAVIGIPDPKWGESVHALVVLRAGQQTTAEEIIEMVKNRKGSVYAPKAVEFVDALPMTGLGKLDKKAMRDRIACQRVQISGKPIDVKA